MQGMQGMMMMNPAMMGGYQQAMMGGYQQQQAMMGGRGGGGGGSGRYLCTDGVERNAPPPGYTCHRCGQTGHWKQDCPMGGGPSDPGAVPGAGYVCKICNVPGHWIRDCPQKREQEARRLFVFRRFFIFILLLPPSFLGLCDAWGFFFFL